MFSDQISHTIAIKCYQGAKAMTTAKKSTKTVKKSPVKAKKTMATKVTKTVKTTRKAKRPAKVQSFRLSPEAYSFLSFKFTEQTIYWGILLVMVFALTIWVLNIQISTNDLIDSIKTTIN